ncbi:MAG: sugar phosphate isomerase/epimerase [Saprospiraceae bacterium]|nr:sugar phosphate isomerase/epimerase [Saprospiraceae bacterium]
MYTRRNFIKTSGSAAFIGGVTPQAFIHFSDSPPLHKKSLKYGMIQESGLSILEKFQLIKDLGFHGVELDSPHDLDESEILDAKAKTGIEIPGLVNSLHWKKPLSDPDPAVREECTESMKAAFHQCKKYGGTTVLLVPAVVNKEVSYGEAWERSTVEIEKMLPAAKETGIKIAIENVWNNFLLSPLEATRYVDQFDSEMIGWYFDVGNVVRYGWPSHWIEALGHRIIKIDVKEYSRKKQQEEGLWKGFDVELGEGDSDWDLVNKALKNIGYSGWGSAEVKGGDRDRLRAISVQMDEIFDR